jgi:hypothetical protein
MIHVQRIKSRTKRANLARFQPSADAMEMKSVIANTPCNSTALTCARSLVRLAFNTVLQKKRSVFTNGNVRHVGME